MPLIKIARHSCRFCISHTLERVFFIRVASFIDGTRQVVVLQLLLCTRLHVCVSVCVVGAHLSFMPIPPPHPASRAKVTVTFFTLNEPVRNSCPDHDPSGHTIMWSLITRGQHSTL